MRPGAEIRVCTEFHFNGIATSPVLKSPCGFLSAFTCCSVLRPIIGRMKTIRKFLADESAATAIEYGLIAAGIALAIITAVNGVGTRLSTKFTAISTALK